MIKKKLLRLLRLQETTGHHLTTINNLRMQKKMKSKQLIHKLCPVTLHSKLLENHLKNR